jgi:hypothetical protein
LSIESPSNRESQERTGQQANQQMPAVFQKKKPGEELPCPQEERLAPQNYDVRTMRQQAMERAGGRVRWR